ncbi:hypothetical protein IDJ75_00615 [Mucilaginibacter rigui]|uniref:PsbP C-terminal domain-containing protein n=1 Tax=Mucilaginibacter rigui TaxID=534635 RepID=A0ABR7WZJ0_9SPHI|nr:hypothetical protein [Mucilaginibacter rigui]MBD1383763.1 hypothetical protein [Mucilaginibacter rigui]
MKKIFLTLTISIITAITCQAQLIHTSDFVKVALPDGAYKLNKQQVDALPGQSSLVKMPEALKSPYTYNIHGIILNMNNVNKDSINNNMLKKKRFLDELAGSFKRHGNNTYTSIVKNFNNNHALITNYIINNTGYYEFYVQNAAKTLTLAGKMEYNKADAAKAESLLNDIINNVQFTK